MLLETHTNIINRELTALSNRYSNKTNMLDLGCYNCDRTMLFYNKKRVISGIDLYDSVPKKYKNKIKFIKGDFLKDKLPFRKNSFDLIFSFDVIEHLKKPEKMLKLAYRLLKTNGVFILSTPNKFRILGAILIFLGLRKFPYAFDKNKIDDPAYVHEKEYSEKELKKLLLKCRFKVIETKRAFYGLPGNRGLSSLFSLPGFHNIIVECVKKNEK